MGLSTLLHWERAPWAALTACPFTFRHLVLILFGIKYFLHTWGAQKDVVVTYKQHIWDSLSMGTMWAIISSWPSHICLCKLSIITYMASGSQCFSLGGPWTALSLMMCNWVTFLSVLFIGKTHTHMGMCVGWLADFSATNFKVWHSYVMLHTTTPLGLGHELFRWSVSSKFVLFKMHSDTLWDMQP